MTTEADESAGSWIHSHSLTPGPLAFADMVIKKQAAEIERLKAEAELFAKHVGFVIARKDALLRECLSVLSASYAEDYDEAFELRLEANIKTELGESP